jgi:hypothetical protein
MDGCQPGAEGRVVSGGLRNPVHGAGWSEPDGVRLWLPDAPRRDTAQQRPLYRGCRRRTGRLRVGVCAVGSLRPLLRYDTGGISPAGKSSLDPPYCHAALVTNPCPALQFAEIKRLAIVAAGHDQHSGGD